MLYVLVVIRVWFRRIFGMVVDPWRMQLEEGERGGSNAKHGHRGIAV
jgi:hypothetical protein